MKRHSTIVSTLALVAGFCVGAPATAAASGPLLSGYGGPGAGSQAILGSALLGGGSGGSSQGGSGGGSVGGSGGVSSSVGSNAAPVRSGGHPTGGSSTGTGGPTHGVSRPASTRGSATHPGAAGASPQTPSPQVGQATGSVSSSWFSGADLLALVLAVGVLVLVGLATVRIARTQHH